MTVRATGLGRASRPEFDGHRLAAHLAHLLVLLASAFEAHPESFDLAEPASLGGLADPLVQVRDDLGEALDLSRIGSQHGTA